MADVQFDDEKDDARFVLRPLNPPKGMYRWLITIGVAKNNDEAQQALGIIAFMAVIIGIAYPFIFG